MMRWIFKFIRQSVHSMPTALILATLSIAIGISCFVATRGLYQTVSYAVEIKKREINGADIVLSANQEISEKVSQLLKTSSQELITEVRFPTMLWNRALDRSQLIQLRAVDAAYPLYGLVSMSQGLWSDLEQPDTILLEEGLREQLRVELGDQVKLGNEIFTVRGSIAQVPGEFGFRMYFGPRAFISRGSVPDSLVQQGSRAKYYYYLNLLEEIDASDWLNQHRQEFRSQGIELKSAEDQEESILELTDRVYQYLQITTLAALILAGAGIGVSIMRFVHARRVELALLRLIGARLFEVHAIIIVQLVICAFFAAIIGILVGLVLQNIFLAQLEPYFPVTLSYQVSGLSVFFSALISIALSLCFAAIPLRTINSIQPLEALRSTRNLARGADVIQNLLALLVIGLIVVGVCLLLYIKLSFSLVAVAAIILVCCIIYLVGNVLFLLLRKLSNYIKVESIRQGILSFNRPNNVTLPTLVALGLGIMLLTIILTVRSSMLAVLDFDDGSDLGNTMLVDVQIDQKDSLIETLNKSNFTISYEVPIVSMRIQSINGVETNNLRNITDSEIPEWTLRREYRSTYRHQLFPSEKVIQGEFISEWNLDQGVVPISIEEGLADKLKVKLADEIVFSISGVPISTKVSSIRQVDWKQISPNFFIVFPVGALEEAPQFFIIGIQVNTTSESVVLRESIGNHFANISIIDLRFLQQVISKLINDLALLVSYFSSFIFLTSIILIIASMSGSSADRLKAAIQFRILGASNKFLRLMRFTEHFSLGFIAGLVGLSLGLIVSYFVCEKFLKVEFSASVLGLLIVSLLAPVLTVILGAISEKRVTRERPLELLRSL